MHDTKCIEAVSGHNKKDLLAFVNVRMFTSVCFYVSAKASLHELVRQKVA